MEQIGTPNLLPSQFRFVADFIGEIFLKARSDPQAVRKAVIGVVGQGLR